MYPDFLCIGAQKAGTDWLYHNLGRHPDVSMPPVKEIHYFDRPVLPLTEPFWTNMGCIRGARHAMAREVLSLRCVHETKTMRWALRFLFVPRSDEWYQSLFDNTRGQIAGDVTPAYGRLDESVVARIHERLPHARIIYILRNPIHRSWSQAVMHLRKIGATRDPDLGDLSDETIRAAFGRPRSIRNDAYSQTLDVWGSYFPSSQIFIPFFDDIVADPRQFLRDCFRFLGIDADDRCISPLAEKRFNTGKYKGIPERFHRYLSDLHRAELYRLNERFHNRHTLAWLEESERSLARDRPFDDARG